MSRLTSACLAFLLLALVAAAACDNPRPVAPLNNGLPGCREIRKLCAAPADAFGGDYSECLEIGVANVGSTCLDVYDSCVEACRGALMSLGGAGGEGGVSLPPKAGEGGASTQPSAGQGGV